MRIILVGGGHTHALLLARLAQAPIAEAEIVVIAPDARSPYTGMLPGFIEGAYEAGEITYDVEGLCRAAGARSVRDRIVAADLAARRVTMASGGVLEGDLLSLNTGIRTRALPVRGAVDVKPLAGLAAAWDSYVKSDAASGGAAIAGSGLGAAELSLAAAARLGSRGPVTLIVKEEVAPRTASRARARLTEALSAAGVRVLRGGARRGADGRLLAGEEPVQAGMVFNATGPAAPQGLGRWQTNAFLEAAPGVFAVGDCGAAPGAPATPLGVVAVRQAPVLEANLRHAANGRAMRRPFVAQSGYMQIIGLGGRAALALRGGDVLPLPERAAWALKQRLDRRFMARLAKVSDSLPKPGTI